MAVLGATANPGNNAKSKYIITQLSTPTITIGGKSLKVGSTFSGSDNIKWNDKNQMMEVKNTETGEFYQLSKKLFDTKGALMTAHDYFLRTNKASTRSDEVKIEITHSEVANQFPEKRIALVIGNSNYFDLSYLRNGQRDAQAVAEALNNLGFDVIELYEASYSEMKTALNRMVSYARNNGYKAAVFYFSGHGVQDDNHNYLIPIESPLSARADLQECIKCDEILEKIDDTGADARMVFFDACRNVKSWKRSPEVGLAKMEGTPGCIITFSTLNGMTADDGDGLHSPFSTKLLENLGKPGVSASEMIGAVVRDTYSFTDKRQCPVQTGTLLTDFSFNPKGVASHSTATTAAQTQAPKQSSWEQHTQPVTTVVSQTKMVPRLASDDANFCNASITCHVPSISVKATECKRIGNVGYVDLLITNKGKMDLLGYFSSDISSNNTSSGVYENTGIKHPLLSDIEMLTVTNDEIYWSNKYSFPAGIPVKVRLMIKNLSPSCSQLSLISLGLKTENKHGYNGSKDYIRIAKVPVVNSDYESLSQFADLPVVEAGSPVLYNDARNIKIDVTKCLLTGNSGYMVLTFTNNDYKDRSALLSSDGAGAYTEYLTENGVVRRSGFIKMSTLDGQDITFHRFDLPSEVPVSVKVDFTDLPQDCKFIPYIKLVFKGMSSDFSIDPVTMLYIPTMK